jgi:hypothetical protein
MKAPSPRLLRALAVLAPLGLVALALGLYAPLLWGDLPINHDHPVLLLRAWIMGQQLAAHGTPYGFSPFLFAGNPADGMYAVGTDLLINGVRALTLGLASWEWAYCWALLIAILAYPLALYALGRRIGGPLAGLLAGLLGLVDRGGYLQSGWDFTLNWGVWPMGLSFSLCLWSAWALDRLVERPSRPRLAALAGLAGGALIAHPMAVALLGVMLPVQAGWTALARGLKGCAAWVPSLGLAMGLAGGLAAFWYLPFLAHGQWFEPLGLEWRGFGAVQAGLLDGTLLTAMAPALVILGLVGLLWASLRRNSLAAALLLVTGLLLYVSSNSFLLTFDVLHKLPGVANLQLERFSYVARATLLLGAGLCAALLWQEARRVAGEQPARGGRERLARALRLGLAGLVLLPFLVSRPDAQANGYFIPANRLEYASDSDDLASLRQAAEHLKGLDPASVGRVALENERQEHLLTLLPVWTGLPVFKVGFTPENNYRFRPEEADAAFREALGVSHVLSVGPRHRPGLVLLAQFGRLWLYRVEGWEPQPVALRGPGSATVERDEPGTLEVRLAGTAEGSRLTVHRARFPLWRATLDGQPVELGEARVGDSPPMLMQVAARDGLLRLTYRAGAAEWLGGLVSLLALLGLAALLALHLVPAARCRWERLVGPWRAPLARWVTAAAGALALLALLGGGLRLALPKAPSVPGRQVVADLAQRLGTGQVEVRRAAGAEACEWKGRRHQCPREDWSYVGPAIVTAGGLMRQCTWMHPVGGGRLALTLPLFPLGERLQGHHGLSDSVLRGVNQAAVRLSVLLDGQEVLTASNPNEQGWFDWAVETPGRDGSTGEVTLLVETSNPAQRHFCLTLASTRALPGSP